MKDNFIFYKSFYEAIKKINNKEVKADVFEAICELGLYDNDVELTSEVGQMIMTLITPVIKANTERYLNGKKGGAPKGNQNAKKDDENNQKNNLKQPNSTKNKPNDNDNDFLKENKKRKAIVLADNDLDDLISEEFKDIEVANKFRAFIQMRKAKGSSKAVKTKATFDGLVKDLRKFAGKSKNKALAILDKAINNCWQGLFDIPEYVDEDDGGIPYAN